MRFLLPFYFCLAVTAHADVTSSAPGGFTVEHEVVVSADRPSAYRAAIKEVGAWWSSDHTITGDASRLSIEARPLGCFCEQLGEGDAVVHLVVTFINRDVIVRLSGGLGPLGLMGVAGNMTWEFFDTEDGGTRMKWTYAVGGYRPRARCRGVAGRLRDRRSAGTSGCLHRNGRCRQRGGARCQ